METKTYKDGVTLIADAIRKEQAKQETTTPPTVANVSDITAQFSNVSNDTKKNTDTTNNKETENVENKQTERKDENE